MALTPSEQEEFLAGLGLTPDGEVPETNERPKKRPRSPVADLETLPTHVLRELPETLPFDGNEEAEEGKVKAKTFFDSHKAARGDIRTGDAAADKALKTAYNSWLWKAVTGASKAVKQERRALARAVASTQGDEGKGALKQHIKRTAQENEEELVARVAGATVEQVIAQLQSMGVDLSKLNDA